MLLVDFTTDIGIWIKITQKALWQITELDTILSDSHPTKLHLKNLYMCCTLIFFLPEMVVQVNDPELLGHVISIFQGGLRSLSSCLETLIAVA